LLGYGSDASQRETVYGTPAGPPTAKIAVLSAVARAARSNAGSRTKTIVPAGAFDLLAVDREDRVSGHHGVEFLAAVRLVLLVVGLVMLFDHLVAGVSGRGVDAERLDVEMATDEMERAVVDVRVPGVDLGQGVHVGQADGAVRCGAGIAHGADTATFALTRHRTPTLPQLAPSSNARQVEVEAGCCFPESSSLSNTLADARRGDVD
jgi:hypothetical protein